MNNKKMKLRPISPEEEREQLIEFYNNPPPEWVEYYKNKKVKLTATNGKDQTMAEKDQDTLEL